MTDFSSPPQKVPAMHGAEISARADAMQREASELFALYGRSADAPRPDETDEAYMRRLLDSAKRYSPVFANVDFTGPTRMRTDSLPSVWKIIVSQGVESFKRPEGELRRAVRTDQAKREITEWYGDELEAWLPFVNGDKRVRINPDMGRGKYAPGAIVPVQSVMSDGSTQWAS